MLVLIRHRPFFSPFSCFWTPLPVSMDSPLILRIPAVYDASLKLFKTLSHTAWTGEDRMLTLNDSCMLSDYREKTSGNHQNKTRKCLVNHCYVQVAAEDMCWLLQLELAFYFPETLFVCVCKRREAANCLKATCAFTGSIQSVISFLQESSRDSSTKKCPAIAIET